MLRIRSAGLMMLAVTSQSLPAFAQQGQLLEGEAPPRVGKNSFGNSEWLLPDPPTGHGPHDYVFNQGPGGVEMLLFHDRALRGEPSP